MLKTEPGREIEEAIDGACRRIAPLWPLKHFVAVNPFLGFSGQTFHSTCATMHRVARIEMLMPREFYRQAIADGTMEDRDLELALSRVADDWKVPRTVAEFKAALGRNERARFKHAAVVATVAEVLDSLAEGDRTISRTAFMTDEISRWCAAYFDEGQSAWRLPSRHLPPYAAWRAAMRHDRNAEVMGIGGFRAIVASLPEDPVEAIVEVVHRQGVAPRAVKDYLHQALLDIGGWAAYARYLVWNSELVGKSDDTLVQLLAIRLAWGYALFVQRTDDAFKEAWRRAMEDAAQAPQDEKLGDDPELCVNLIAQEAYELAYRRKLLALLASGGSGPRQTERPVLQAAFCIDVRSEVYRRNLELVFPQSQTIGFAGFFGYPIEYVPIGNAKGGPQCPVLLTPKYTVCEVVEGASDAEDERIMTLRRMRRRVAKAWKSFKVSAVSSFVFVETAGLLFAVKILSDALALTRTVHDPNTDGLDEDAIDRLGPRIEPRTTSGRRTGFDEQERLAQAESTLRSMSMTRNFGRLVLMAGHGSKTVNNPHASSLDCGACGGHTGEANARVAAKILNYPDVRSGLRERGIDIPDDTWFIGALHDTTTDEITMYDVDRAPESHRELIEEVRGYLKEATSLTRRERARLLDIPNDARTERSVVERSRDWAQVRPEWGLAGNASFVAAPRSRTRGIDLGGRAFLHDYDWHADEDFGILELIMTAPVVVATWINLQYYGSVVNNRAFGSGNKVLHNVTGTIGVLEGNAGDLKVGLPWQSVHDGTRFVHEPLRLSVFVEAPIDAMNAVIAKNQHVRDLADHRWLHLFAIDESGRVSHRYRGNAVWEPLPPTP